MKVDEQTTEELFAGPVPVYAPSHSLQGAQFGIKRIELAASEMEERSSQHFHLALWESCATGEHAAKTGRFQRFIKPPGSLTFVPPGMIPAARTASANFVTCCVIRRDFMRSLAEESEIDLTHLSEKAGFIDARIRNILELLSMEAATGAESGRMYLDQLVTALGIRILALGQDRPSRKLPKTALQGAPLQNALEEIQSSGGQVSLETLAKHAGFSRRHFLRMFQQATGLTPYAFALKVKLEEVQRLMLDKRLSLMDIALSAGFSSHSHLTRTFRGHFGISPSRFRRSL